MLSVEGNMKSVEGRPLDDEELVDRARHEDGGAYERLVERYQAIAHRVAYLITRSGADADDATQEAFVKAYYALGRFRSGASFRPWILKIVANEARNRRRAAGRRADLTLRAAAQRSSGDAVPSPEAAALEAEERAALMAAVNRLSDKDRLAVSYRYFLGLSEADMAAALGCAKGTVKSRLSRALARLRRELEES
jgi:RNA polymerase sigma factor (sigma-70 family)